MSTLIRPNGYFLADTNSLVYAYRAGGTKLLDTYFKFADKQGREFAITETVAREIKDGPLEQELGRYIADKDIKVLPAPKLERQLETGQVSGKNAGEASMLEVAAEERKHGRSTRIWSDDKFFENPQQMRGAQGAEPVKTSQLLDQMRESQFITDTEYRRTQARYQAAVPEFKPASASHSQRLATFDGPAPHVLDHLGAADARIAGKPGFQALVKGGSALGAAGVVYGGISTTREAVHQLDQGNVTGAQSQVMHFGASVAGGALAGAAAGAAYGAATGSWTGPGAVVTGLVGGFVGAVAGDQIMDAADRARIYNQRGSDGNLWHYDERHPEHGWNRAEQVRALDAQGRPKVALGMPVVQTQATTADAHLADELNYKASNVAVELALAHPRAPQDPFRQAPESIGEAVRSGIGASQPWIRDPQSHAWTRQATEAATPTTHGMPVQRTAPASPEQSRQLDAAAQRVIADNLAHSPQAIAQRYQEAYTQHGWKQHGPLPAAVTHAAQGPVREEPHATPQAVPAQPQPANGHLTPQQIERITTHESRIVPTPGGMSFAEAHKRRDEPEQISAGSLQPVGKLDEIHRAKGGPLYRVHQAHEQTLMRDLEIAQAQDRHRFGNEPSPRRTLQPSVERTQERAPEQAPALSRGERGVAPAAQAHFSPARPAAGAEAMHSPTTQVSTHASVAAPMHSNPEGDAAAIAAAQAQAAAAHAQAVAAQAELAQMHQRMARMSAERGDDGLERRDERDERTPISATAIIAAADKSRPLLRDFSDPGHPQNALYSTLKDLLPKGTSEERLAQGTAACHRSSITEKDLSGIYIGDKSVVFASRSLFAVPAQMDISQPAPSVQLSDQHIQQTEQQRAQVMSEIRAQNAAQANQQQGPVMG
ncbi:hypothetical protein [Variovorax paradoxus]|uniref:hypothetical protein n=1 Tax=Variovorax paradoxus TaxID=34073 RepID=UPI003D64CC48